MKNLYTKIRTDMLNQVNEKKKLWWENYVKHNTEFLGVPMEVLRKSIRENKIAKYSLNEQIELAELFFADNFSESKIIGILIHESLIGKISVENQLNIIADYFNRRYIFDWNVCDWLFVKVLTKLLNEYSDEIVPVLLKWADKEYLWHARASLVPFAQCQNQNKFQREIWQISEKLIRREERFAKTAVGWVMREWNKQYDSELVIKFCRENSEFITSEVFNNIFKHFDKDKKRSIKEIIQKKN